LPPDLPIPVIPIGQVATLATRSSTLVIATARAHALLSGSWPAAHWRVRDPATASGAVRNPATADAAVDRNPAAQDSVARNPAAQDSSVRDPAASGTEYVDRSTESVRDPDRIEAVIVVGGGALIDDVKRTWRQRWPAATELIAVPTIWGSGAEASPVAVWTEGGKKHFQLADALRPTAIAFEPAFAESVSPERARDACGDVWAHAIEGFLSPLATAEIRTRLAEVIGRSVDLPVAPDARWFEIGAEAASLQARSSVGLVHGLAHVLEPALADGVHGHARLCALLIAPVLRWNAATSTKWTELTAEYGIDRARVDEIVEGLGTAAERRALVPAIEASWRTILRDPCTRTNSALVRPDSLAALLAEVAA
jgi:alcohol dehydrogenase class IV